MAALVATELQQRVSRRDGIRGTWRTASKSLCQDRRQRPVAEDLIDLVWTGPEAPGIVNRETSVVVRELFRNAGRTSCRGRLCRLPGPRRLQGHWRSGWTQNPLASACRCTCDIQRPLQDNSSPTELVRRFAERFVKQEWPGRRLPRLYYDPRSLEADQTKRTSLHAKCVVVDNQRGVRLLSELHRSCPDEEPRSWRSASLPRVRSEAHQFIFDSLAALSILKPIPLGSLITGSTVLHARAGVVAMRDGSREPTSGCRHCPCLSAEPPSVTVARTCPRGTILTTGTIGHIGHPDFFFTNVFWKL